MRVKAGDPVRAKTGKRVKVFLDGVDVSAVAFEADDEEGWVDCYETDAKGQKIEVVVKGVRRLKQVRVWGKVQIVV